MPISYTLKKIYDTILMILYCAMQCNDMPCYDMLDNAMLFMQCYVINSKKSKIVVG